MMEAERLMINHLIAQQLQGEDLTSDEKGILENWLKEQENKSFFDEMADADKLLKKLEDYHYFQTATDEGKQKFAELGGGIKIRSLKSRNNWQRYVAAASIFFLLASGVYVWLNWNRENINATDQTSNQAAIIPAGKDGAILSLTGGQQLILDDAADGTVTQQGAAQVNKQGSVLAYNATGDEVVYNTLSTPRGRQFQLALPDGSRIWLNAASSVTFPTAFPGKERKIEITGECYMEISKSAKPFIVTVGGMDIEVYGTSFNVNSYKEENAISTTLIEGSIKVRKGSSSRLIKPGQQAQVNDNGITVIENANTEAALAWKNGLIVLNRTDIKSLFNAISRWYDVEVEVKGEISSHVFFGNIPRSLSLNDVVKALGNMTNLKYTIEGKKLIVSQ